MRRKAAAVRQARPRKQVVVTGSRAINASSRVAKNNNAVIGQPGWPHNKQRKEAVMKKLLNDSSLN
jgi:hypothetical protein